MKPIELREADFRRAVDQYSYPKQLKDEFIAYWTEPNKSGTKMRFELEKTWHLGRRLARWANNRFSKESGHKPGQNVQMKKMEQKTPVTDFEKLDAFMEYYFTSALKVKLDDFGKWYDFMKQHRLLREFTKQEANSLLEWYNGDKYKCRCAAVQQTLDGYRNAGLRVTDIIKLRERLNGGA